MRPLDTRLALLLLALGLAAGLVAQTGNAQPWNVVFRHFDSDAGLHSTVHAILQDRRGFMWFGHSGGITKFDGYRFVSYEPDPDDANSARSAYRAILEDRQGMLWMGAWEEGLSRFDPSTDTFTHFEHDEADPGSLSDNYVGDILEDGRGTLWISTRDGVLHRLDRETERFTRFPLDAEHLFANPNQWPGILHEDQQGRLWIGAWGLLRFDPDDGTFSPYLPDRRYPAYHPDEPDLLVNAVTSILDDGAGGLWIGTMGGGLYRFDPAMGSFSQPFTHDPNDPVSLSHNDVRALLKDTSGALWVGTFGGGLNYFDPVTETFTSYRHRPGDPRSLSDDDVLSLYEDRQGGLWIGTWGGGVSYFDRSKQGFAHYKHDPLNPLGSLSYNEVYGIYEDHEGMLWIATVGRGLSRLDRKTGAWTHFRHDPADPTSLSSDSPFNFYEDRDGVLWIGTQGLDSFDRETETFTHYADVDMEVYFLTEDRQGVLWLAGPGGLYRFDRKTGTVQAKYKHDPDDPTTIGGRSNAILEDHAGTIWVTSDGLDRFNPETETFTHFKHVPDDPNSLSHNHTFHIHERQREPGILWVSTYGGGLNRFDTATETFTRFTEQNSDLPSNRVNGSLEDEQGRLWINTENGLSRFTPETGEFKNYGLEDGLQGMEFEVLAHYRSESGEMFFGGQNGFNAFFPDTISDNSHPPQVALTDVKLFNKSISVGADTPLRQHISFVEAITLAHAQNDLSFEYAGLHYSAPERNQYAYQLDGYDAAWRAVGVQRTATYTALPPGNYVFRVKASNSDGVWNEKGVSVRITIRPPWWRTPWAYAVYGLLFLAGVVAVDRVQRRRLLRKERERAMQHELAQARQIEAMNNQLRLHEKQLEDQNRKLLELDDLKSRFFANISHEFRTPLTLILGPLKDLLDEAFGSLWQTQRVQLTLMQRNARRLLRLINQLLDLSRLEAGHLTLRARQADVVPLIKATAQAFASLAQRKQITLHVDVPQQEILLYFEPDKLEKVLYNLLSNAFKFTPELGEVKVEGRISRVEGPQGYAEITVRDTGRGIPAEALPFIFDRFHQVDASSTREQEGSGIGLALTKELVALHGGTIRVESTLGVGSTFYVCLPRGRAHLSDEDIVEAEGGDEVLVARDERNTLDAVDDLLVAEERFHTEDGRGVGLPSEDAPVILIVEDNDDVRGYLRSHLAADYRIVEAVDGVQGLKQARTTEPALVLSDVMMPGLDGYTLCRAIKTDEKLCHIPVVLLTAKADEESKLAGLETGADDYLYKPFNAEELLVRVENLIEIRRRLRAHFSREVVVQPAEITVTSADAAFLEQVRQIVEAEMCDSHFSVERLADEVNMSPRQLRRRLRALTKLSPSGYIRSMRLQRAAQLLEQQAGRVSAVAYAVGFQNAEHFSRLFQQVFGVSPSQYSADQH